MKSGSKKSTTTNKVVVPPWLDVQNQDLVARATALSKQPYQAYEGERLAGLTEDQLAAFQKARDLQDKYTPLYDLASQGVEDLFTRASGPSGEDVGRYMNPYLENVLSSAKVQEIEQAQRDRQEANREAAITGAFGGSRNAVREALDKDLSRRRVSDLDYRGRYDAFNQALGQYNKDTAVLSEAIGRGLDTGAQGQAYGIGDINTLLGTGGQQQAQEQAGLDIGYGNFLEERAYPYEQTQYLQNILQPYTDLYRGSETTTKQSGGGGSTLGKILGAAGTVASFIPGGQAIGMGLNAASSLAGGGGGFGGTLGGGFNLSSLFGSLGGGASTGPMTPWGGTYMMNEGGVVRKPNGTLDLGSNRRVTKGPRKLADGGRVERYGPAAAVPSIEDLLSILNWNARTTPLTNAQKGIKNLQEKSDAARARMKEKYGPAQETVSTPALPTKETTYDPMVDGRMAEDLTVDHIYDMMTPAGARGKLPLKRNDLPVREVGEVPEAVPLMEDAFIPDMPVQREAPKSTITDKLMERLLQKSEEKATNPNIKEFDLFGYKVQANLPLLNAGIAMMSSDGDFFEQLAAGGSAFASQLEKGEKDVKAQEGEAMDALTAAALQEQGLRSEDYKNRMLEKQYQDVIVPGSRRDKLREMQTIMDILKTQSLIEKNKNSLNGDGILSGE